MLPTLAEIFTDAAGRPKPIVVAIAGGAGTGKSSAGKTIAQDLRIFGIPAIWISTGIVFRLFAYIALAEARRTGRVPLSFTAQELVEVAKTQGVRLTDWGIIFLGTQRVLPFQLKEPSISAIVGHWGNDPATAEFAKALVREMVLSFAGVVVVEGRSVCIDYLHLAALRSTFVITPELAAIRCGSGTEIETIVTRDAQDVASGALPARPIGYVLNMVWFSNPDQVASQLIGELMERTPLRGRADIAPICGRWFTAPWMHGAGAPPTP